MQNSIILNKKNNTHVIILHPERPFLKITGIEISPISKMQQISSQIPEYVLSCDIIDINEQIEVKGLPWVKGLIKPNQLEAKFELDYTFAEKPGQVRAEFKLECKSDKDVIVYYTQFDRKVELTNPLHEFNVHLSLPDNVKILFSAPFGQGKTTFLNHFFDKEKENYEVFRLYPVNYAVSHNEDIFKYIKSEILFQLMGKDVEFDKQEFDHLYTGIEYLKANPIKIISPLISIFPKIGKSAAAVVDGLYNLAKEYLDYHKSQQVDDKVKVIQFVQELYEKEGSIFEDNFYTQVIRQLLSQHKQKYNRKNVLIIDDIDRMDPDHIFRIFNVFAAHFDSNDFANGYSNKFGFDKIILVCDYNNIKRLFAYRYGSAVAFNGYLSKYYSKHPFNYDNNKAIGSVVEELMTYKGSRVDSHVSNLFKLITKDLIFLEEITLRDLLKLLKYDFYQILNNQSRVFSSELQKAYDRLLYFNIIAFFNQIFDLEILLEMFTRCARQGNYRDKTNYTYLTSLGFIPLVEENISEDKIYVIQFRAYDHSFKIQSRSDELLKFFQYYEAIDVKSTEAHRGNSVFSDKDFYEVLKLNVEKYIELAEHKKQDV